MKVELAKLGRRCLRIKSVNLNLLYGDMQVVTHTGPVSHSDCGDHYKSCSAEEQAASIVSAAVDLWAMASTDYQVRSRRRSKASRPGFVDVSRRKHAVVRGG